MATTPASAAFPALHDSAGLSVNPTTATVLADTGAVAAPGGLFELRVLIGASVAATFTVQHRNAANSGNVSDSVVIRGAAGQTGEYLMKYSLQTGERLRVLPNDNVTGDAEATVNAVRVI